MGNGVENNELWKKLQATVMKNSWMQELYGSNRAEQQEKIKAVFTVVADNNLTSKEKNAILAQAETLQDKVERLEAKMAVLEEEMSKNQEEIDRQAAQINDLVTQSESKSKEMQETQKKVVEDATEYLLAKVENGSIRPNEFAGYMYNMIKDNSDLRADKNKMENILANLKSKQGQVNDLVVKADKWLSQRSLLKAQYGATKSTYDLLKVTAERIGSDSTTYTNSDYNKNIPTYSPEKVSVVSKYSENPLINVEAGENTNYVEGSQAPTLENINTVKEKYKDLLGANATGEHYSSSNVAVQNLGKALDMGLMDDLMAAGLSAGQMQDFIAENFAGAQIQRTGSGLKIPYGHDSKGKDIYSKLIKEIKNYNSSFKGALNTWDEFGGNTISSNKQIASLSQNYETIFKDMQANGFTFKEAMFAMFDPNYGMFKDSGVVYDVDKQGDTPNYFIEFAGDDETAEMYKNMSGLIYNIWGVKPSRGATSDQYTGENGEVDIEEAPTEVDRTDPLAFSLGDDNNVYSFIMDRNKDGAFTDASDFVGGGTSSWLDDLKTFDKDGDGKISGAELDDLMLLGTKFTDGVDVKADNNEYTPDKVQSDKKYNRVTSTNVDYTLTSASDLGIASIDLNNLEQQVNQSRNVFDVNGSELFNDSFSFTMQDGSELVAKRKDETSAYMDTVYGGVYGKGFKLGLSENQVDEIMTKDYGEYDRFDAKYAKTFENLLTLKNLDSITEEVANMYDRTLNLIDEIHSIGMIKANYQALSMQTVPQWDTIKHDVIAKATAQGLPVDEYGQNMLKGIFIEGNSLTADDVINRYKELLSREEDFEEEEKMQENIWRTISLATASGVSAKAAQIEELFKSGQVKTPEEAVKLLSEAGYEPNIDVTEYEIGFDSDREKEIYETFNKVFNEAGYEDRVVEALAVLCVMQQDDKNFMIGKTAQQIVDKVMDELGLEAKETEETEETEEQAE